jgi:hypothetical protein
LIALVAGSAAAIFLGFKNWWETWDWYLDKFRDGKILAVVKERKFTTQLDAPFFQPRGIPDMNQVPFKSQTPFKTKQVEGGHAPEKIAKQVGRSPKTVLKSLGRLERRGKVTKDGMGTGSITR